MSSQGVKKQKSLVNHALKYVARFTQPHLTKLMGANKPAIIPWRTDPAYPNGIPPTKFPQYVSTENKVSAFYTPPQFSMNPTMPSNVSAGITEKTFYSRPYRILCLDGGGVRGIVTVTLLRRILQQHPNFLDNVDMICGTSVGGIISLLLAAGYSPQEVDDIYMFSAPHIFGYNPWRVINPFRSRYSDKAKQELMQHYFGNLKFGDLKKTATVVAFRLDGTKSNTHSFFGHKEGWRPAVFSNVPKNGSQVEPDLNLELWDAAMRTSAAPTFFPVFKGYTDGGIVANNPSILAASKAMAHYKHLSARNVAVLSLGAGTYPRHINIFSSAGSADEVFHVGNDSSSNNSTRKSMKLGRADWGIKQWIPFLLDLLLDGDSITTEMVMHYLLGGTGMYHRLDPQLPRQIALDDASSMLELKAFAQAVPLQETLKFVDDKFCPVIEDVHSDFNNALDHATNYHDAWESSVNIHQGQN